LENLKTKLSEYPEYTVEANPESVNGEKLRIFAEGGVNRLSIGVQSFNDAKLKKLGRIHDSLSAKEAVCLAQKTGFQNINIDLMFGVRGETFDDWKKDLEEAVSLPVRHISCYCLDWIGNEATEDDAAQMYGYAIDFLTGKGFAQYEISNFAKKDFSCRHNLTYWNNDDYTGLGASAVSYSGGSREENTADIADYIKKAGSGTSVAASGEKLDKAARAKETAAIKIRMMEGINFKWFKKKTGYDLPDIEKDAIRGLFEKGLIEYLETKNGRSGIVLTRKGILLCDVVSSAFM
jgi:oxygen-independent coproporphyrinogen-3 oxidase